MMEAYLKLKSIELTVNYYFKTFSGLKCLILGMREMEW
jgi:hypothetical protein